MGDSHSAKRYYIHGFIEWVTVTVPSDIIYTVSLNFLSRIVRLLCKGICMCVNGLRY